MEQSGAQRHEIVTAFLQYQGRILLMRHCNKGRRYRGRWSGISGYLEEITPLEQALLEIRKLTGLEEDAVQLVRACAPIAIPASELNTHWVVHPFLFNIDSAAERIRIAEEHVELRWVTPAEVRTYPTVPALLEALEACLESR